MHAIGLCTVLNRAAGQNLDKSVIFGGEGRF
jgi:hypothetical protein